MLEGKVKKTNALVLTGFPVLLNVVGMSDSLYKRFYLGDPVLRTANVPVCKFLSDLRDLIVFAPIGEPSVFVFSADIHFINEPAVVLVAVVLFVMTASNLISSSLIKASCISLMP